MPRIRTLKPEFFRSPDTAAVDFPTRIFYQALWCWADDFGIGETNINGLLGFAFPDEDGFTAQDLRRFCADVAQHYGVTFYTVHGRHYYAVKTWEKHQKLERRSERRKNPLPDDADATPDLRFMARADSAPQVPRNDSADRRDNSAGTGEQGNRGTEEKNRDSDESPPIADTIQTVTTAAYERTGKSFNFIAVRGMTKWLIGRGDDSTDIEDAIVAVHESGKPITKQTLDQHLKGHGRKSGRTASGIQTVGVGTNGQVWQE